MPSQEFHNRNQMLGLVELLFCWSFSLCASTLLRREHAATIRYFSSTNQAPLDREDALSARLGFPPMERNSKCSTCIVPVSISFSTTRTTVRSAMGRPRLRKYFSCSMQSVRGFSSGSDLCRDKQLQKMSRDCLHPDCQGAMNAQEDHGVYQFLFEERTHELLQEAWEMRRIRGASSIPTCFRHIKHLESLEMLLSVSTCFRHIKHF